MSHYVLLTKFWNEAPKIPSVVETVANQDERPLLWLLLDDGSTDGSLHLFVDCCKSRGIPWIYVRMRQKYVGNIDTLGFVYQKTFDKWKATLDDLGFSYLAMLDVDSMLPPDYFSTLTDLLEEYPRIGAIAGQVHGERRTSSPQGSGKLVRWEIVKSINKYWDLDADSFFNIKANAAGYWTAIVDNLNVYAEPSLFYGRKGSFRFGRRMFYVRRSPVIMFLLFLRGILRRRLDFLDQVRGYVFEASRNNWECKDPDVRRFYGLRRYLARKTKYNKMLKVT